MIDFRSRIGAPQVFAGLAAFALVTLAAACAGRSAPTDRMLKPTLGAAQAVDTTTGLAVLPIVSGRAGGAAAWFVVTEATDPMVAAMEGATWAPALAPLAQAGSPGDETRMGIVAIVNGPTVAEDSLQRHGLRSALRGEGDPQNILEEMPGTREYTPLWDLHMAVWSPRAVRDGERERLLSFTEVAARARRSAHDRGQSHRVAQVPRRLVLVGDLV